MKKSCGQARFFNIVWCVAWLFAPTATLAGTTCPNDPQMEQLHLPHLRSALADRTEGLIVALGSSSTQGAMASDSAHTYPAVLQSALNKALPDADFAVINRGVGGQDAPEELSSSHYDFSAARPRR
jgi:hypothetical protein